MKTTLLLLPAGLVIVAAVIVHVVEPQVELYTGCLFCASAPIAVVAMAGPLENEVGRVDAAHLFSAAWFVLLTSSLAAGSLWNISMWTPRKRADADVGLREGAGGRLGAGRCRVGNSPGRAHRVPAELQPNKRNA